MKKHLLFSLFIAFFAAKATASITVVRQSPASNYTVVPTKFAVTGYVTSTYEVTNVTATIGSVTETLNYVAGTGHFSDSFSLASFHEGDTLRMIITATDYFNNQAFDTVKVIYDNPPVLTSALPLPGTVARPGLPISIYCSDADSCTLNVYYRDVRIFSTKVKDSFKTTLNLLGYTDGAGTVTMSVTDKRGQKSSHPSIKDVYTEGSLFLNNYYFDTYADGSNDIYSAYDFNGSSLLAMHYETYAKPYFERLVNANIATDQHGTAYNYTNNNMPYQTPVLTTATLTQSGAVYTTNATGGHIYEWYSDGDSIASWPYITNTEFVANSNYWLTHEQYAPTVTRHNIVTRKDTVFNIHTNPVAGGCSVALNGAFACAGSSGIFFAKANGQTFISHIGGSNPATDGNYVVYNSGGTMRVFDGTVDSALSSFTPPYYNYDYPHYYQVNNKFIAYTRLDFANQPQVWLRDSLGHNTQLTFFGTGSIIDNIDSNGDVVFLHDGHRYYAERGGAIAVICSTNGKTYFEGNTLYLVLGREVFTINTHAALPLTLLNFTAQKGNAENLLTWTTANETSFSYFGVENSTNGVDFRQIGQVQPKGSGTYNFTHAKPMAAINYYRLKLQDKDGRFTYSPVRSINNLGSISIQLSPNPVSNMLKLNINGIAAQKLQVLVVNMLGKTVLTTQVTAEAGSTVRQLNIGNLSNGSYVVKVITAGGDETSYKFIKQ